MKQILAALFVSLAVLRPGTDAVPDAATATRVARVLLEARYGKALVRRELPLTARLKGSVWQVVGTSHAPGTSIRGNYLRVSFGGTFYLEIDRRDCRVLTMTHGK